MKKKHIAFIPAREGSVGFKHKNRLFFNNTADFLDSVEWYDNTLVSTDDSVVSDLAKKRNYLVHSRSSVLSGPDISIKAVLENVVCQVNLEPDTILWLFFLPILYKERSHFDLAKSIIEQDDINSLCTFVAASSHPYNCWKYDEKIGNLTQYIPNDVFRRQDLPPAWQNYHYVYCCKVKELSKLNSELINADTHPIFLPKETVDKLIEVDTPKDYEKWKRLNIENK